MISFKGFSISWLKKAEKPFDDLENPIKEKIWDKIDLLISDPAQLDIKKLQGYIDLYRISYGDYRVIFRVISPSKIIVIAFVCHQRDVYKKIPRCIKCRPVHQCFSAGEFEPCRAHQISLIRGFRLGKLQVAGQF